MTKQEKNELMPLIHAAYEKALREIIAQQVNTDYELAHARADDALRTLLKEIGLNDLVEAYDKVGGWYA